MTAKFVQHRSPQNYKAKAPYNFVPLPEKVLTVAEEFTAHDKYDSDRHTGYIELEIKTETPLYTRCAFPTSVYANQNNFDDKGKLKVTSVRDCQDFFHRGNAQIPVIPGSTLRGMTRCLVEIFSYSKINFVSEKQLIYRAVADSTSFGLQYRKKMMRTLGSMHFDYPSKNLKGGYLEIQNGKHYIRPAQEPNKLRESFVFVEKTSLPNSHRQTGSQVYVQPVGRTTPRRSNPNLKLDLAYTTASITNAAGLVSATIVNTEGIGNNKHLAAAIYEQDASANLIPIPEKMWKVYEEDRDMQRSGKPGRHLRKTNNPLFYLLDDKNELIFFGPTMMFRLPYNYKAIDLIPEEIKNAGLDMAESIFGMVDENSKKSIAGRVFFSDAVWNPTNINESPFLGGANNGRRIPKILSSPKPTAFQLYLNQNEPNHHHTDPTRWFMIKESSIERMREEGISESICEKIKGLIGEEYKSKDEYLDVLNNLQVRFNDYQQNIILNCSSHELRTYDDLGKTEIRGFKRYWHKKNVREDNWSEDSNNFWIVENKYVAKLDDRENEVESSQHTIIRPVKENTSFHGQVYFENLTESELGALLTALELPDNMRHQIGMGKPHGLGSIKIKPTLVVQKREIRYESLFDNNGKWKDGRLNNAECEQIKKQSSRKFKDEIKSLLKEFSFNDIQRLKELYTLLAWEDENPTSAMKNYIGVPDPHWTKRFVLPFPTDIDQITIAETEEDINQRANQIVRSKETELANISDKKSLKKFGKRLLELDITDKETSALAKALFIKADELRIDLSKSEWFEEVKLWTKVS